MFVSSSSFPPRRCPNVDIGNGWSAWYGSGGRCVYFFRGRLLVESEPTIAISVPDSSQHSFIAAVEEFMSRDEYLKGGL
jgi:hypothetical protein